MALIFAYVVSGKIGLTLALPPGYASAIFPPAGIAIAAYFVAGKKSLPAIFLGSLILNIWVGYASNHQINTTEAEAALLIAAASTIQALTGGWWLRRKIGYPSSFDKLDDVIYFFASSPAICLISASLSISGLFALGLIGKTSLIANWAAWCVGDTLGLMVMLPLTLVAIGSPRKIWRERLVTVALPMVITFALLIITFVTVNKWEQKDSLVEFDGLSQRLAEQIQIRFEEQESALIEAGGLFMHRRSDPVSRQDFHYFIQDTLKRFPMILAMEWAPRIESSERLVFEQEQSQVFPGFKINEYGSDSKLKQSSVRDFYFPVTYIEPLLTENLPVLGVDVASQPDRLAALLKSFREKAAVATPPFRLIQQHGSQAGMLLIYGVNGGINHGIVQTVLKAEDFMGGLFTPVQSLLNIRLVDVQAGRALYNSFSANDEHPLYTRTFLFGTRHYQLETAPTALYYEQHRGWQSWSMLAIGIFGTGVMGALLLLGTGYTARVKASVEEKTAELQESASRFEEITSTLGEGVYVMDMHGFITFVNPEAQHLLGYSEQELIGQNGHMLIHYKRADHSHYPEEACGMRNVMNSGMPFRSSEEVFWRKDGSSMPIKVTSVPIIRQERTVGAVVVFDDISGFKKMEYALRTSEERFRDILDYAPIGMSVVSLQGRFERVNLALCKIVGYSSEELEQLTFQEITHQDDLATDLANIQQLLDNKIKSYQMEKRYLRKDKSIVWIQLTASILRDDDNTPLHFIAQIEDITERLREREEIQQLAHYDTLTHLPNRRLLLNRLDQALSQAKRYQRSMALMFLDLDHFKHVNDTLGHAAGDMLLKMVAIRLSACVRDIDTVSRQGGDEFVIILAEIAQEQDVQFLAERIIDAIKKPFNISGTELTVSTSIGIAVHEHNMEATSAEELMKRADMAMYEAKGAGRSRYHFDNSGNPSHIQKQVASVI